MIALWVTWFPTPWVIIRGGEYRGSGVEIPEHIRNKGDVREHWDWVLWVGDEKDSSNNIWIECVKSKTSLKGCSEHLSSFEV